MMGHVTDCGPRQRARSTPKSAELDNQIAEFSRPAGFSSPVLPEGFSDFPTKKPRKNPDNHK